MKRIIKEIDTKTFYNVMLNGEESCSVSINEDDVTNLFENATNLSFLVTHGDKLKDALKKIDPEDLDFDKATKAIFVVRCSRTYQITVSELSELALYINANISMADVRWGLATKSDSEWNVTVVTATTH